MMIIDMGSHMLSGQVGSQNVLQVAVPGLEDRTRTFSPLHGVLLMPGKDLASAGMPVQSGVLLMPVESWPGACLLEAPKHAFERVFAMVVLLVSRELLVVRGTLHLCKQA